MAALDRLHPLLAVPGGGARGVLAAVRLGPLRLRPALRGLAGLTLAPPAPWTTDRPARVGRPRLVLGTPINVDWELVPGEPRAGDRVGRPAYRWLNPPDSSLVMATDTGCLAKWSMDSLMSSSSRVARSRLTPWRTRIRCTEMSDTEPVKRVGRDLPTPHPQAVGDVVEGVAGVLALPDPPGHRRDAGLGIASRTAARTGRA